MSLRGGSVWIWGLSFIGILFDFLDGFAARLFKVTGELGKQLDSLADMVTSGVVPGIIPKTGAIILLRQPNAKYAFYYFKLIICHLGIYSWDWSSYRSGMRSPVCRTKRKTLMPYFRWHFLIRSTPTTESEVVSKVYNNTEKRAKSLAFEHISNW